MQIDLHADRAMLAATKGHRPRRPRAPLLSPLMDLAGGKADLLRHSERAWASVTFSGTRHSITLAFIGEEAVAAGEAFLAALPDHEFTIPRQIVADASIVRVDHDILPQPRLEVEAELLLIEDC